ncbi:sigma-54-dependent transcriptional regulator [Thiomonas bhubaneswarensis]|uniref:DNA-binding transcriptional response regulator, NtrC family, contains REC, AAA-type ATPase, and a Fis-type DNA-binding domains n=1 Tax=Thiomonas bhubaneswarensis TaxID=339866 RepID=A0A0K6I0Q4_9BURK|nr:sigma-54 dependent transcriptional regulator [Thiomonas bhubaneswarensis]CUA96744.1 DNA-binding transcriptional response regulator, NtrC family, contains REC, AAA-type ATPase, and a Fis-type DNA-binding domains [Thiomonas bhubaneswarensis]
MTSPRILLLDHDTSRGERLRDGLAGAGCVVALHSEEEGAVRAAEQGWSPDLVFCDGDETGVDATRVLARLHRLRPGLPVLVMARRGSVQAAVQALQNGAADYLSAPLELSQALAKIRQFVPAATALATPKADPGPAPSAPATVPKAKPKAQGDGEMVAESAAMQQILAIARKAAQTDVTVMLLGESGVGKEVMARYVHAQSPRASAPFIAINCAAIPETLLEATLFGFEKGAFTGAGQSAPGKFEQAQGGTLLLDEVTEMAPALQAKLLRVLQEREIERLGGRKRIVLDLRIIATSNRDLQQAVQQGVLREDVYYRLSVFPIQIPPLRERQGDILPLANAMLKRHAAAFAMAAPPRLDASAQQALLAHRWPGNVRELDNVMQRAAILSQNGVISASDLLFAPSPVERPLRAPPPVQPQLAPQPGGGDLGSELALSERQLIAEALQQSQGSKQLAAQRLGISPRTLRHKLQKLREAGLELPD